MWNLMYSDELKTEIEKLNSASQRKYFLSVYERMGNYIKKEDSFLTFKEYFEMFERDSHDF